MLNDVIRLYFSALKKKMMTSDFVTGRMAWNTAALPNNILREVAGKGPKKEKKPKSDFSGLTKPTESAASELDTLVSSMQAQETLPGSVTAAKGTTARGSSESGIYKKAKPRFESGDNELYRLASKYGLSFDKPKGSGRAPSKRKAYK